MSLRLLAGPFDLLTEGGSPPTNFAGVNIWYEGVGQILDIDFNGTYVATLDGVFQKVTGKRPPSVQSWWARRRVMVSSVAGGSDTAEIYYEPNALVKVTLGASPVEEIWPYPYVILDDRRIYFRSSRLRGVVEGVETIEGPVFPFTTGYARAGRSDHDIFVAQDGRFGDDTMGCFYQTKTQLIVSPIYHLGMPCESLNYAPEYGVLVSVHDDDDTPQLRVWSLEVLPATISAPISIVANTLISGHIATYQVQVLGDHEEPCVDELVEWSISSGVGTVLDLQSRTDDEGYAITRVLYGVTESGDSVVEATLRC